MVMVLMDLSGDQSMSSSSSPPPISLAEQIARPDTGSIPSPSPFQTQTSTETDEHDDEHSKASNQTIVTMQQASQQQTGSAQNQHKSAGMRPGSTSSGGYGDSKQQRMIVSGGSSFGDEDDESRLMMSVDSEEETSSRVVGAGLRLEQAELESRLKHTRFGHPHGSKPAEVESSLVAQMRDIVEGTQRNIAPVSAKSTDETQDEDKENTANVANISKIETRSQQPKSSNDSLSNNQKNDNGQSRVSMDSAGQKRTRHVSRHQCRHHHHHHHNSHHHHHHHHRHRQSISGGSLPGQIEIGTSSETATSKPSSHTHHHRYNHSHNHNHHHHHLGRQHHSNTGHHHHHHHHYATGHNHHGHHHHHHHQNQQESEPNKRGSPLQRLSLALIEAGSNAGDRTKVEATDGCTNDSSISSVSSLANRQRVSQTTTTTATIKNPNQSKSSEMAVSGEHSTSVAAATKDGDQIATSKELSAPSAGHSRDHHHHHHHHGNSNHHYHHQHCQHRSNKRRLVVDTRDSGEKHNDGVQESITSSVNDTRREPLKDLAKDQTIENKSDQAQQHQNHHHQHHHHRSHYHCAHRHGIQVENQQVGDGDQSSTQSKVHLHHHHNYCSHRHHRYHHHHHHHHQPGRQQQQRSRQRSVSQTNVTTNDNCEKPEVTNPNDEIATELRDSTKAEIDEMVKMETSPPQMGESTPEEALQASDEQATPSAIPEAGNKSSTELLESNESVHEEATYDRHLNERANFMCSYNQDSLRSGSDEANDRQQQQQPQIDGTNKLTRQMSSQSLRRSQNAGGALPPAGSQDSRQSDHLRKYAERALQPATETTVINQRENELTRQPVESANGLLADRRCRLCWCCCCPCSALSTRDASNRPAEKPKATGVQAASNSPISANYPSLPNVPLEEIRSWGESFDKLMRCSDGRKVFQDFLRCEYSEENILFWSACEELKKEKDSKSIAAKARDIYEDYISILSSKEVSLDSRVRDVINNNIKRPTSNIFDEAQLQIYTLMHRDSYPRFINSIMYKKLARIPISNSRKSSS